MLLRNCSRVACTVLLQHNVSFDILLLLESATCLQELDSDFIELQKAVDGAITGSLEGELKSYLSACFSLRSGDRPHLMKF